jgi:hypothetical protein
MRKAIIVRMTWECGENSQALRHSKTLRKVRDWRAGIFSGGDPQASQSGRVRIDAGSPSGVCPRVLEQSAVSLGCK